MTDHRSPRSRAAKPADRAQVIDVDFSEVRTGEDVRQRGWFWHWNELHTEYGPLLRQSGIGLLTSYIVYTDRRESSPHRGFAFPSLQLQAAFTGADRAELITINQILVALDLLEIRKEMVVRADEQGRKWRVPHNLYRVKDKSESRHLTAADVLRVLELAEKKREVYRHIRHIFSAGFTPISRGNIWHQLLPELRETELWQRLATRAERDEAKFSERSRAGHAARKSNAGGERETALEPIPSIEELRGEAESTDSETTVSAETPSVVDTTTASRETTVAQSNQGSSTTVAASNNGSDPDRPTTGAGFNKAQQTSVAPSNPMYDQSFQTTRTTTGEQDSEGSVKAEIAPVTGISDVVTTPVTNLVPSLSQATAPEHGPDRAAAVRAFAEANGREASPAEERLLAGIAAEVDRSRQEGQSLDTASGWAVVCAAIYEAVDSGSSFVAPKRVREIVRRWLRDGLPEGAEPGEHEGANRQGRELENVGTHGNASAGVEIQESDGRGRWQSARGAESQTWVESEGLGAEGTESSRLVPNTEHPEPNTELAELKTKDERPETAHRFWVAEGQISSTLLWETIVGDLVERGIGRRTDLEMYLRPSRFTGRSGERGFVLETPNQHARRRIELHWLAELEQGLARLLGGTGWEIELSTREDLRRAG